MAVLWRMGVLAGGLLVVAGVPGAAPRAARLPAIVFVSRVPLADPLAIPGLGPSHRAAAAGGRLLVREADGRVRDVLPEGALFDVSDPSVLVRRPLDRVRGLAPSRQRLAHLPGAGRGRSADADHPRSRRARALRRPRSVLDGRDALCFASTRGGGGLSTAPCR